MFWSWGIVLVTTTASNMELLMRDTAGPEKMPWVQMAYTFTAPASNNLHEGKHRYTTEWRKNTSPTKRWQIQVSFTMVRSPYLKWFTTRKCVLHSSYRQQNNCPKRFTLKHDQGNRQKLQQGWCTCSWHGNTVNNLIRYTGTNSKHWVKLLSKQRSTTAHSLLLFCLLTVTSSSFSVYWQSLLIPFLFIDSHSLFLFCLLTVTPSSLFTDIPSLFSVYWQSSLLTFLFTDAPSLLLFCLLMLPPSYFSVYWCSLPLTFLFTDAHSLLLFCLLMLTPSYFSVYWCSLPLTFLFTDAHSLLLFCLLMLTPSYFSVYWCSLPLTFLFTDAPSLLLFCLLMLPPSYFSVYWCSLPLTFLFTDAHSLLLFCSMTHSATGVGHIVHKNGDALFNIPDQNHGGHLIGLLPLLVDQGKVHIQSVRDGCHSVNKTTQ